jgi:hypothetical protein
VSVVSMTAGAALVSSRPPVVIQFPTKTARRRERVALSSRVGFV